MVLLLQGVFTLQLYKHGSWHAVVVDSLLPLRPGPDRRLLLASSAVRGELWPALLEKAYAKLHGGYAALGAGSLVDALVDLTGGVPHRLRLDRGQDAADVASGASASVN